MKEWENLYNTVKSRKTERIENSYTNYLFDKGKEKILKKIGEEVYPLAAKMSSAKDKEVFIWKTLGFSGGPSHRAWPSPTFGHLLRSDGRV